MREVWLDLETIATHNVVAYGLYAHCEDPTLDITMVAWAVDMAPVEVWWEIPEAGTVSDCPAALRDLFEAEDTVFFAHNAAYERMIIKAVWGIDIPADRWRCTSVIARWYNMPASLDGYTGYMLGGKHKKIDLANAAKRLWSTASLPWGEAEIALFEGEMIPYGIRDVDAMRAATVKLPPLPDVVWEEYAASEDINDRGVSIDKVFSEEAAELRSITDGETRAALKALTGGEVTTPRGPAPRKWMEARLASHHDGALLDEEGQLTRGFKKRRTDRVGFYTEIRATFDKAMRATVREFIEEAADYEAMDFLDLIDEGQNAAITKYNATNARLSADGRLRGMYVFGGASQTHRFSSTGVQTHNLLRDTLSLDDDLALRRLMTADAPMEARVKNIREMEPVREHGLGRVISMALRGTLKSSNPETQDLYWADWSAIEARGLPWLANDGRKLQMFEDGVDPYIVNAADLYRIRMSSVDKSQRQVGKVQELALGYGGAAGAFAAMARGYGVRLSAEQVKQAVKSWRENNPVIVDYWSETHDATFKAMRNATTPIPVGNGVHYLFAPNVAFGALLCALPCGAMLVYPNARIEEVERFEDQPPEPAICFDHPAYGRSALWHGTLVENQVQAICASLLRNALVAAGEGHHAIVAHTHDELVGEAPTDTVEKDLEDLIDIMQTPPSWCAGLPLAAEGGIGSRYKVEEAAY